MGRNIWVWGFIIVGGMLESLGTIASGQSSWDYCSLTANYKVKVQDVVVDPDPVVRGSVALFRIPAFSSVPITGGKVVIEVFFIGIPVRREIHDLCSKTSCPVAPGEFILSNSQALPGYTPTGRYQLEMRLLSEENDLLTCIRINFRIVKLALQQE
eukprot:c20294_g1_i1 orf=391-858(-)